MKRFPLSMLTCVLATLLSTALMTAQAASVICPGVHYFCEVKYDR